MPRDTWGAARPGVMGVMSGDPGLGAATVWSATDRPGQMWIEWSSSPRFTSSRRVRGPTATANTGYTAATRLTGLPEGEVFYRVRFEDDRGQLSRPSTGRLWTPPSTRADVRIGWGGDVVGQGFGIDPDRGGLSMFKPLTQRRFDLFIHSGDHVYADNPLPSAIPLDDGTEWKNIVTPAKAEVAQTLDDFRGQYAYNMLDANYRAFFANTPVIAQWDDHEVRNNWYPAQILDDDRYQQKSVYILAARAKRAFFEFMPVHGPRIHRHLPQGPSLDVFVVDARTFRAKNSANAQRAAAAETAMFGPGQLAALKRGLLTARGTWKIIASDVPLGLVIPDGPSRHEGLSNGHRSLLGREHELASLLRFIQRYKIRNVVFVTADVHYAAAHHYAPERASFTDFDPFWEFVAGPLHAGTFGPNPLDSTFGPRVEFCALPTDMKPNRPPSEGQQFFGELHVDGESEQLHVSLHNASGTLYRKTLDAIPVP
ncbi:MAG: alkaline phosphatase D family protein [Myxococcota bacterium]